jgi:hypothetical protein
MAGLVPAIHVMKRRKTGSVAESGAAWMAGTSPAMTEFATLYAHENPILAPMGAGDRRFRGEFLF